VDLSPLGDVIVDKSVLEDMPGKRELAPFFIPFTS
jgi:hypothetical protein